MDTEQSLKYWLIKFEITHTEANPVWILMEETHQCILLYTGIAYKILYWK